MRKIIFVKPRINKANNQINISLPRKELPEDFFKVQLSKKKLIKLILEGL